jgi:GT2 family glycosyltransferase
MEASPCRTAGAFRRHELVRMTFERLSGHGRASTTQSDATEVADRRWDVSVIICSYAVARWQRLSEAVESVREQTLPPAEIIVVVDHNPGLAVQARRKWPGLRILENAQEPGLSGARNTGLWEARSEIVAFLDDDAIAAPDWLERLVGAYGDDRVVAAGGAVVPRWEPIRPRWFPQEIDWVVGCSYTGMPQDDASVRNLIGANMSFRREVLLNTGGFDVRLGRLANHALGCEETHACVRATQALPDALVLYRPTARVFHAVPAARATWTYFAERCRAEGRSKAALTRLVGRRAGLSTELAYARRTLLLAVARNLRSALRGDAGALARAAAIALGLALTGGSYLREALEEPISKFTARLGGSIQARAY